MAVIDMQAIRYINLLDKVSRVKTHRCFIYNNTIFFAVNKHQISKAIGFSASNIRKIQEQLEKKVRIIREPESISDVKKFVEDIVSPIKPRGVELKENCIIITAGNIQNKASLIGREKRRYDELRKVLFDFFKTDLKII